jgi:hypothetical protein
LNTTFQCAVVGCIPEYRDWAGMFGGEVAHVTGPSILPGYSRYKLRQLAASCEGNEASCVAFSDALTIFTAQFGNVDDDPQLSVLDLAAIIDDVKDLATGSLIKPRAQLQPNSPNPTVETNVLDVAWSIDTQKDIPFTIGFAGPETCE